MKIKHRKLFKDSFKHKKLVSWISLSKNKRKDDVISLKNKIGNWKRIYGANFYSHEDWDSPHNEVRTWSDIYFTSKKYPDILYNTTLLTAQHVLSDVIDNKAIDETYSHLSIEEQDDELQNGHVSKPCKFDAWGHPTLYTMEFRHRGYSQLNNMSVFDHEQYLTDKYWKNPTEELKRIIPGYEFNLDFAYGIGLTIIIDTPILTTEKINSEIDKFLATYEESFIQFIKESIQKVKLDGLNGDFRFIKDPLQFGKLKSLNYNYPSENDFVIGLDPVPVENLTFDKNWYVKLVLNSGSEDRIADILQYIDEIKIKEWGLSDKEMEIVKKFLENNS